MTTKTKYTLDYRGFRQYTEDHFARTYRSDSDAAALVEEVILGLRCCFV